jgi:iron complex transport system substrate-binding protein
MRRSTSTLTRRSLIGALAGLALVTTACGSDDGSSAAGEPTATTTSTTSETVASDVTATTVSTEPPGVTDAPAGDVAQRIVSLSPTATEMMFAIGAGDLLVAVDDQSNHPADATELPNDLSGFEPNVEAIAAYEPDLVLMGGDFTGLGAQLDELEIAWWDGPAALTIDDTYQQIEELGDATGNAEAADALVQEMQAEIEAIVLATPEPTEPLTVYHELDPTLYSADSTTFIGALYSLLGLRNIADTAEGDSGGFPQLNPEFIVSADPDLIFLADTKCCGETAATVAARPGWDVMTAVQSGNVFEMDDDIASRWGPRVVDYLRAVADAVEQAAG